MFNKQVVSLNFPIYLQMNKTPAVRIIHPMMASAEIQNIMELNWTLYLFNLFLTNYTYIHLILSFNSCVGV